MFCGGLDFQHQFPERPLLVDEGRCTSLETGFWIDFTAEDLNPRRIFDFGQTGVASATGEGKGDGEKNADDSVDTGEYDWTTEEVKVAAVLSEFVEGRAMDCVCCPSEDFFRGRTWH